MSDSKSKKFSDMFRDNKEVIRLLIECAVIVGILYYFNKRISNLSKHIEEISQKLELQDDIIEKQDLTITELSLHLNSKPKSSQQAQQPFFQFEQKQEQPKVNKVSPAPKPILKSVPQPQVPKSQTKQVPNQPPPPPQAPPASETPRVKFVTPRSERVPEIDIFKFLNTQQHQSRPIQTTQEIEILGEGEGEEEEIQEVQPNETEEELLDKELQNEMKDLD